MQRVSTLFFSKVKHQLGRPMPSYFQYFFSSGFQSQGSITNSTTFKLVFKIDSGISHSKLRRAYLWLFSEPLPSGVLLDLHLRVIVEAANATRGASKRPVYTWDSRESCISLDVTAIMKKLFRYLQVKKRVEKTNVTITVTLTKVMTHAGVRPRVFGSVNTCRDLEIAGCNQRPFLVLKYYTRRFYEVDSGAFTALTANSGLNKHPRAVSSPTRLPGPSPVPSPTRPPGPSATDVCTLRNLTVNLSQKFNSIVAPQTVNIGDCVGNCSAEIPTPDKFSAHAFLKQTLTPRSSCCVPIEMGSLHLLMAHERYYRLISLQKAVVKTCGCR